MDRLNLFEDNEVLTRGFIVESMPSDEKEGFIMVDGDVYDRNR